MTNKEVYTKEVLLDIMEGFLEQILNSDKDYPETTLNELRVGIKQVLKENGYNL